MLRARSRARERVPSLGQLMGLDPGAGTGAIFGSGGAQARAWVRARIPSPSQLRDPDPGAGRGAMSWKGDARSRTRVLPPGSPKGRHLFKADVQKGTREATLDSRGRQKGMGPQRGLLSAVHKEGVTLRLPIRSLSARTFDAVFST